MLPTPHPHVDDADHGVTAIVAAHRRAPLGWRRVIAISTMIATAAGIVGTGSANAQQPPVEPGPDGPITVEVLVDDPARADSIESIAEQQGGDVVGSAPGVVMVDVASADLARMTASVDGAGGVVREPLRVDVRPENVDLSHVPQQFGPTTTNADRLVNALAWHAAGRTGKGIRIGIIDYFDVTRYWDPAEHGPTPVAGSTARCFSFGRSCTGDFFDGVNDGGENHGVAIVEVVRDIAPDAEIFIGQATTLSDYRALIEWFASKGVSVINRSLGSRYDGPGDGRGPLDEIAAEATRSGMLWVNSGGNNGERRYYRNAVRMVGGRVAFGPSGTDSFLEFRGCVQLAGVRWANDWDLPPGARTDYDVYLWDSPPANPAGGTIVDQSNLDQRAGAPPLEHLGESSCPAAGNSLFLEVRLAAGSPAGDVLEVADYGNGIAEYVQAPHSAAVPIVDSDDPGVIAVGSIDPPGGSAIAGYSSQGPTNDGRTAPDVTAVSGFPTQAFGSFSGTSASSAAVAGAAALLLDGEMAEPGHALGDLIRHLAVDRGARGPDSVYGHGQFVLPEPPTSAIDTTPSTFVGLDVPRRVLDTRTKYSIGPRALIGQVRRGEILDLPIVARAKLPTSGVSAVAVNVTSVAPDRASHVQVMPTGSATVGAFSNLNLDEAGQVRANFAIVPVGADGSISIYSIANGNIVVDLLGWFRAAPSATAGGRFVELPNAQRVVDSRTLAPIRPLGSGAIRAVPLPRGVDPARVDALVVNVTATRVTAAGWVQAIPAGARGAAGATSTLNVTPGDTVANAAIVPVGPDGVALTASFQSGGSADVIVDVTGYITSEVAPSAASGRYVAVRPDRAIDTRLTGGALRDKQQVVVDARKVGVPAAANGVVWTVTIARATRAGHTTGWAADAPMPGTSLLNWSAAGQVRAAGAITAVDRGRARFAVEDGPANSSAGLGHLVVDVFGYFT